jgi:hypothetical protein
LLEIDYDRNIANTLGVQSWKGCFAFYNQCKATKPHDIPYEFIEEGDEARVESLSSEGWELHFTLAILLILSLFLCCFSNPTA